MLLRFLLYGLWGWCSEILWTAATEAVCGTRPDDGDVTKKVTIPRAQRLRLAGHTCLWMLPIYGSAALLFEPVHETVRALHFAARGAFYMVGIFAVEALAGLALRWTTGRCPWDYSYARTSVGGVIRLDNAPVWFAFGLLLERVHDVLVTVERPLRAAIGGAP